MKAAVLLSLALLGLTQASVITTKAPRKVADVDFVKRQKDVLSLLVGVGHENTYRGRDEPIEFFEHPDYFTGHDVLQEFKDIYNEGFLAKDALFTLTCKWTRKQTIKLFDLFFHAKDWETFFKIAVWARHHLNGPQFSFAFSAAILHRPDCHGLVLPPLYEVFPHTFVPAKSMHKIFDAKMEGLTEYTVLMNNSGWEDYYHRRMYDAVLFRPYDTYNEHVEEKISYFKEDVGLGDYMANLFLLYPTWLDDRNYTGVHYFRRGEMLYYTFQQLFARYALERFAHAMPKTEMLFWEKPLKAGYNPKVTTFNGHALFPRADGMIPEKFNPYNVHITQGLERRIKQHMDMNHFYSERNHSWVDAHDTDTIDKLGKIIWGTKDSVSPKYYKHYFYNGMKALGYMVKTSSDQEFVPGAMGYIWTAVRDPAFYQFLHRMLNLFQFHKKSMPQYTKNELGFEGVKIESFNVDKLITFFERHDFEIGNAVPVPKSEGKAYKDYHYTAKQFRLNHKPFTYKLTVSSDKATDAMIRIFIGPKHDSLGRDMTIEQARMSFVEMDRFPVKLTNGQNVMERKSREATAFAHDAEGFRSLYKRIDDSLTKKEPYYVSESYRCGMPNNLMLPIGWKSGQSFTLYAVVSHYDKHQHEEHDRVMESPVTCGGSRLYDGRSYGFPFDRSTYHEKFFHQPNMIFKDVLIYHMEESDVNRV